MRMTQEMAKQIAFKMCEKKHAVVKKLLTEYQQYITDLYVAQTPKTVLDAFKKHSEWFVTTSNVFFSGHGFNHETVTTTKRVISSGGSSYSSQLHIDAKIADKAKLLQKNWQKEKEKVDKLEAEIRTALNGLRTFAQIQKNLPEAVPYLPKSSSVELMVNLEDLRTKIKAA